MSEFHSRMFNRKLCKWTPFPTIQCPGGRGTSAQQAPHTQMDELPASQLSSQGTRAPTQQRETFRPRGRIPPEAAKDPGKICIPRAWILPEVLRSEDLSEIQVFGTMGSKAKSQDWLKIPKNKNRPRGRCQISSTKWNEKTALEKATGRVLGSCTNPSKVLENGGRRPNLEVASWWSHSPGTEARQLQGQKSFSRPTLLQTHSFSQSVSLIYFSDLIVLWF